jgi:hypothetical protein
MVMQAEAQNDADESSPRLTLATEIGLLDGAWRGSEPVRKGDVLDVELDFTEPRRWSDLTPLADGVSAGPGRLRAVVAARHDDGVIIVRIGSAAAQLEVVDDPPEEGTGMVVSVSTDDLEFFPTGI